MFYLIGSGIAGYKEISLKGIEACKKSTKVYIERYTNIMSDKDINLLSKEIGKEIVELNRDDVESRFEEIVKNNREDIALIVVGDPLTATTHIELLRSCKERGIKYKVIHSSSIYSAVSETGLHIYKFGKSCSIPFKEKNYNPTSFFDVIESNYKNNAHTLVFLDIKKDENRYMSINQGLSRLIEISKSRGSFLTKETKVIGIARLGYDDQIIKYGTVEELMSFEFGSSPHIIVIPKMSDIEEEYVSYLYN